VENIKVPKTVSYHSLKESMHNPIKSSQYGMLETPDLRFFGRSDQLHIAIHAVLEFQKLNGRLPHNTEDDLTKVVEIAKGINEQNKTNDGITVDPLEENLVRNTAAYATSQISAQAAFFGGMVAQEIVKFTGKYSPLKQWLHYDIFETLPKEAVDRTPMNCRYDD
jgi:ubiquitin-activating enzyme E1